MITLEQDEVNEGAHLISLLIKSLIEVNDGRALNEQDDDLMAAAVTWVEAYSDSVEIY
jgi:hypothetical protein|tara:strand:+ start:1019 stop:1192 length:174 start_codon:yes stop_codon:yes gene_type:complete